MEMTRIESQKAHKRNIEYYKQKEHEISLSKYNHR